MRAHKHSLCVPFLAVILSCSGSPYASRPPPQDPPPSLVASLAVTPGGEAAGSFSLATLGSLAVSANVSGAEAGAHAARIDVFSPRGTLYAQFPATVIVDSNGTAQLARVLEVHGTPVEAFQQVGTWRFAFSLDEGAPVATAQVSLIP